MSSISATSSSGGYASQMEQLIDSYMKTRQPELDLLKTKKTTLENKRLFYTKLKTNFSSLNSQIDKFYRYNADKTFDSSFKDTADKLLNARKVTSSDESFVKASASNTAVVGNTSIRVNQLASNDVFVGKQNYVATDAGIASGEVTYNIQVLNKDYKEATDPIENKYKNISVKVGFDGTESNETAMKKISNAFNAKSDLNFNVAYVKDTSLTGRLSITSKNTGEDNKLDLSFFTAPESTNPGVNSLLGLDNINADRTSINTDNTQAKFKVANASDLNSKLNINGIDITRSSNSINDLLPGVTLNLLKVHSSTDKEVNLSTEMDPKAVTNNIEQIISAYNDIVKQLGSDKTMLRSDSSVNNLKSQFRNIVSTFIEPAANTPNDEETLKTTPRSITDLGYKANKDGTLSMADPSKLEAILKADGGVERLSHFLNSENGFTSKLKDIAKNFGDNDSILDSRRDSIDKQLEANRKKTDKLEGRIDNAANNLRKEYTQLLKMFNTTANQYNSMLTAMGTPYNNRGTSY